MTRDKENSGHQTSGRKLGKDQQLLEAARLGQFNQLESILSELQAKSKKRSNPLASLRKCLGPNSIRDSVTGFTCLHHAALNGHSQCVQLILDYGAKVNAVDYKGSSALHLASWAGNLQVVKILLSLTAANQRQLAAAAAAALAGHPLAPLGTRDQAASEQQVPGGSTSYQEIDVDLRNNDQQTPLSLAAQFGHNEVVAELLRAGASVQLRNSQLESPLDLASLNGRLETVRLLLEAHPELQHELRQPRAALPLAGDPTTSGPNHQVRPPPGQATSSTGTTSSTSQRQQHKRAHQEGSHSWSSLLRPSSKLASGGKDTSSSLASYQQTRTRRATLAQESPVAGATSRPADSTTSLVEHSRAREALLLDHSPLHYATRRGHHQVLSLLLGHYRANLMQVTTVGSLLHELALSQCQTVGGGGGGGSLAGRQASHQTGNLPVWRHQQQHQQLQSDTRQLLSLIFDHLRHQSAAGEQQQQQQQYLMEVNKFLNLRDSRDRNVFQLLNEINSRPAQELSQMIYEHCSGGSTWGQDSTSIASQAMVDTGRVQQQQQQHQLSSKTATSQQALFSDNKHINSFVTMKRLPKHGHRQQPEPEPANGGVDQRPVQFSWSKQATGGQQSSTMHQSATITGTQTMDRRRRRGGPHASDRPGAEGQLQQHMFRFESIDASPKPPAASGAMTRSVSNLIHGSNAVGDRQQQLQQLQHPAGPQDGTQLDQGQQQQQQPAKQSRRKRSKSRDLGSLLLEAQQQQQQQQQQLECGRLDPQTDPLYDDETTYQNQPPGHDHRQQQLSDIQSTLNGCGGGGGDSHPLVRSQTDCSHLMGRLFGQSLEEQQQQQRLRLGQTRLATSGNQRPIYPANYRLAGHQQPQLVGGGGGGLLVHQHQEAGLDRKAINRHYHVYEHEFYPPRLINQLDGRQLKQAVAVVPPLNRSESTGATSSSSCSFKTTASFNQQSSSGQQAAAAAASATTDQHQQQQMDRFLGRHSLRMSASGEQASANLDATRASSDQQQNLRLLQQQQHQQQQLQLQLQLHSSHSLESHLSEPHLFETTRRALMRDFDQMLGRELLAGHGGGGGGGDPHQHHQRQASSTGSTSLASSSSGARSPAQPQAASILTGVSLDMDNRGECLTVSGTRIILPPLARQQAANSAPDAAPQRPPRPSAVGALGGGGGGQQQQQLLLASKPRPLSSASMHASSATSHSPKQIIYDLPVGDQRQQQQQQRPSSRTSVQVASLMSTPLMGGGGQGKPAPGGQPQQQRGSGNCAITRPPQERPPPPPASSKSQLATARPAERLQEQPQQQQQLGQGLLLKMGSISSTTSATSTSSSTSNRSAASASQGHPVQHRPDTLASSTVQKQPCIQIQAQVASCSQQQQLPPPPPPPSSQSADFDSGVCTSNSPSSIMSHDSETARVPVVSEASDGGGPNHATAPATTATAAVSSTGGGGGGQSTGDGQSGQPAAAAEASRRETTSTTATANLAPPSPQTAQLCIEAALFPLDKVSTGTSTSEATHQTSSLSSPQSPPPGAIGLSSTCRPSHEYSMDEAVVGWLGKTQRPRGHQGQPNEVAEPALADYENCSALQLQLQLQQTPFRTGGPEPAGQDHHHHQLSGPVRGPQLVSSGQHHHHDDDAAAELQQQDYDIDDEDYAAATSDDDGDGDADASSRAAHSSSSSLEFTSRSGGSLGQYENAVGRGAETRGPPGDGHPGKAVHLLRVAVDGDAGLGAGGKAAEEEEEAVFYLVRPSELARLSNSVGHGGTRTHAGASSQQAPTLAEASTITDEELCASVEQESGLVRFTLRRRRELATTASLQQASSQREPAEDQRPKLPLPPNVNCDNMTQQPRPEATKAGAGPCAEQSEPAAGNLRIPPAPKGGQQLSTMRTELDETVTSQTASNATIAAVNDQCHTSAGQAEYMSPPEAGRGEPKPQLSRSNNKPAKQISLDSGSDQSAAILVSHIGGPQVLQAGSTTASSSSSSSSSKESIRSIVSLCKRPSSNGCDPREVRQLQEEAHTGAEGATAPVGGESKLAELPAADCPADGANTKPTVAGSPEQQQQRQAKASNNVVGCALVSETARRFEAGLNKQHNHYQPVPALRRSHNQRASLEVLESSAQPTRVGPQPAAATAEAAESAASRGEPVIKPLAPSAKHPLAGANKLDSIRQQFESQQGVKLRPVQAARKTICWPPSAASNGHEQERNGHTNDAAKTAAAAAADQRGPEPTNKGPQQQEPLPPVLSRVSANRLSFQRMIEENNNNNSNNCTRSPALELLAGGKPPKPAPPTKPANIQMVASRLDGQTRR